MSTLIDAKFYLEHYVEDTLVSFASERLSELQEEFSSRIKAFSRSAKYCDESDTVSESSQGVSGVSSQVFLVSSLPPQSSASASQSESAVSTRTIDEGEQSDFEYDVDTFCDESDGSNQGDGNVRQETQDVKQASVLHEDLSFNNSDESQNRQNCGCHTEHKRKWVVHNVYKGEVKITPCDPCTNNADKLRSYRLSVHPSTNFKTSHPTVIEYHGKQYEFDGFSLLCHFSLEKMPECSFIHYKRKHTIDFVPERFPENFVIKDLQLFQEFVFQNLLEISDWNIEGKDGGCQMFHVLPRFILRRERAQRSRDMSNERNGKCHRREDEETQLLSMRVILEHLLDSSTLLVKPRHLSRSRDEWKDVEARLLESLVLFPGKRPSCIRLDGLLPRRAGKRIDGSKKTYPDVLHVHGKSPGNITQQNIYLKMKAKEKHLRNIIECSVLPDKAKLSKLRETERKLEEMRAKRAESSYSRLRINSKGCYKTGLKSDICQHAIIVYAAIDHFRYHKSLGILEDRLQYKFKDRLLLQKALRHVSLRKRLDENCHLCNALFNCGLSRPLAGDGHIFKGYMRKRGIDNLTDTMSKLAESKARPSTINHNEALEFLGDAVLEMITSSHLFFMFGKKSEGELSQLRSVLVGNTHLATIAERLELVDFMLFGHWNWSKEHMNHVLANCVEAILGSVFIDGGYAEADKLMRNLHFEEPDLRRIWNEIPLHPLQAREPDGDRHLIRNSPRLQQIVQLEEQLGIKFKHICILARAFTSSGAADDILTGGNNERLEFLGDTLLKYIISDYVFKHFPDHQEGHLTLLRTSLVNARTQATVLRELGIDGYIDAPENMTETKEIKWKFLANVFEALIGGIYVDKGIEYCRKVCEVTLFPRLENFIINQDWIDPKSHLQICCTYLRTEENKLENPEYTLLDAVGPTSKRIYKAAVSFGKEQIGTGTGTTIRGAEAAAARDALESNHFDILAKQNRQLDEKFGHKRAKTEFKIEEFSDESASCRIEVDEEWDANWICEEV